MSIEVVSYHEISRERVSDLALEQYAVIQRNKYLYPQFNIELLTFYPEFSNYLTDIKSSLAGEPVPSQLPDQSLLCDFCAIIDINVGAIIGGFDIVTDPESVQDFRTIGYYADVEGGLSRKGVATVAVQQVVERLSADGGIEFVDAYVHPDNLWSQRVLMKNGFERYTHDKLEVGSSLRFVRNLRDYS